MSHPVRSHDARGDSGDFPCAAAIAAVVECELLGRADVIVRTADPPGEAGIGSATWVKHLTAADVDSIRDLAGALIVIPRPADATGRALVAGIAARNAVLAVDNPRLVFARILARYFSHLEARPPAGIDPSAQIHPSALLGAGVTVGPFCFIGPEVVLGNETVLYPGAVVHARTAIGQNCVIGSNSVIGGPGFGFIRRPDGNLEHFPQVGRVSIEDNVSIGAGTTIDRPGLGTTRVLRGTKIDNQCHIGHNARVGPHAVITACTEVGAGVVVGRGAWLGPNSSSIEGVTFGAGSLTGIGATVLHDVAPGSVVAGCPAEPIEAVRRQRRALKWLVEDEGPTAAGDRTAKAAKSVRQTKRTSG